jgi:signal transduction histidine kinase
MFQSPRLAVLGITGILLTLAMAVLGLLTLRQAQATNAALAINFSELNRPFSQFERELLRMGTLVAAPADQYDAQAAELRRNILESRWQVLKWPATAAYYPQDTLAAVSQMQPMWDNLIQMLNDWQKTPDDTALRGRISQQITDLDFLVYNTEVGYQTFRGQTLNDLGVATDGLLAALGLVSLLMVGFVIVAAVTIYRFIQDQRRAEEKTRAALAAEAAAVENSRFKDQFLATMSHELRTPLNAIIGFLGIMVMVNNLDEKNTHMVKRSLANAERLLAIINDILDLSKLESGRMELHPAPVAPRQLVERWQYQMDILAKQKNVDFVVDIDESVPDRITIDEDAITKIVTNLLSNAFKFTEKGEVRLRVKSTAKDWTIEVSDTGIGIPAHMHQTIFESFRQVDNSFKRPYGGTGLGLSIVQHLVTALDGSIRLQSELNKGSTFIVTLPLTPAADIKLIPAVQYA